MTRRADRPEIVSFLGPLRPGAVKSAAAERIADLMGDQSRLRQEQQDAFVKDFLRKTEANASDELAGFVSRAAQARDQVSRIPTEAEVQRAKGADVAYSPARSSIDDAVRMRALDAIQQQMGISNTAAAQMTPEAMAPLMRRQGEAGQKVAAEALASTLDPGIQQRGTQAMIWANRQLAADGARGNIARGTLYTGIAGGAVAGGMALTEGAQQLIALMQYLQSGQQTEERSASSELA